MALSNYEWSLELYRARKKHERDHFKWESNAAFVREILAMLYNPHRGNSPQKSGKDFIKLSFDKQEVTEITEVDRESIRNSFPKKVNKKKDGK